jgi:multiple sugar transport system permease protein
VIPPVVAVLLWRSFYDASPTGVFNNVLGWFGVRPLTWLQNSGSAMPSIVIEAIWAAAGTTVIIYLAALLAVPGDLYDAAEVDGASIWQKVRYVTLPQLRPVIYADPAADRHGTALH